MNIRTLGVPLGLALGLAAVGAVLVPEAVEARHLNGGAHARTYHGGGTRWAAGTYGAYYGGEYWRGDGYEHRRGWTAADAAAVRAEAATRPYNSWCYQRQIIWNGSAYSPVSVNVCRGAGPDFGRP
jgi:hypothetical protein